MCMPYLGKIFSGGHRRRNRSTTSPRPSLAPTPQQSIATVQTTNNMNNSQIGGKESLNHSVDLKYSTTSKAAAEAHSTATGSVQNATGIDLTQSQPRRPTSWWDYFGMNKNKKGSIDSL